MHQVAPGAWQLAFARVAPQHLAGALVQVVAAFAGQVVVPAAQIGTHDGQLQLLRGVAQQGFRVFARLDIAGNTQHPDGFALRIPHGCLADFKKCAVRVDLGGGVYKKKLNKNQHRSIILAKGGAYWVYEYLFAKNDRDNIDDAELEMFRLLTKSYEGLGKVQLAQLIEEKHLLEIFYDHEKEI